MKYAAYSKYKPSPMAWLDQLPTHWNAASLRWMSKRYAGGTPDKGNEAYWEDGDIPWINSGAVNDGYITQPSELITREGFANSSAKWIPKDALVMALAGQGKTKGMVAQLGIPTTCNQSMAALIPDHRFAPRYLYYWLTANYQNIRNLAGGEARDGLNLEMLGSIPCPVPPVDEQQTIARFLDAKTAQIDVLVVQKRQLIDKLKEKRQALIARTVTRGLPPDEAKAAGLVPNPEMKDSGVEWLGKIPAHWAPKRLRFCMNTNPSKGEIKLSDDELVSFVPMEAVGEFGGLNLDAEKELGNIGGGYTYFADNDVVVAKITPCFENGKGAIARGLKNGTAFGTTELHVMRSGDALLPEYLFHLTMSHPFRCIGESEMYGAGGQKRVPETFLKDFRIGLPPINEQHDIVEYINKVNQKIDLQMQKATDVISRLVEYRSTLITNAVTGKIDVRGLA